jgi:hypothetical protein
MTVSGRALLLSMELNAGGVSLTGCTESASSRVLSLAGGPGMLNDGSGSLALGCEDTRDGSASWPSSSSSDEGCASPVLIAMLLDGRFKLRVDQERLELATLGGSFVRGLRKTEVRPSSGAETAPIAEPSECVSSGHGTGRSANYGACMASM